MAALLWSAKFLQEELTNPVVTYVATQHQERLFLIICKRLKLLGKAGCLQLIQNSAPSVAGRRQCCIRIENYQEQACLTKLVGLPFPKINHLSNFREQ